MTVILPGIGFAHGKPRADLTVSKGSVSAANGRLDGSFVVRNKGAVKAKRSSAALVVRADGQDHEAKRFKLRSLRPSAKRTVTVALGGPSSFGSMAAGAIAPATSTPSAREGARTGSRLPWGAEREPAGT